MTTDNGEKLTERENGLEILSWGMAELEKIKPEEVTRWGHHGYIRIFERLS